MERFNKKEFLEVSGSKLGNNPAESSPEIAPGDWKAKRRAAFRVLNATQKMLPKLNPFFLNEARKHEEAGDEKGAEKVLKVARHSVRKCGKDTIPAKRLDKKSGVWKATGAPGQAEVHAAQGRAGHVWVGVKRCASTWFCPVCGPKIMARRRQEVEKCVKLMAAKEQHFIFVTFTFPHERGVPLSEYMNKLKVVLRNFRLGEAWQDFKERVGLVGYIRAQEVTYGNNGWHPHFHELMITRALTEKEARDEAAFLSKRWVDMCKSAGLIKHGKIADARAHAVDVRCGADAVSQAYLAKVVAWELSSTTTKATKTKGLQPFQILANACNGDKQAQILWAEYMLGMYRKAALYWAPGLKKECGIDEVTDEEILEGQVEREPLIIATSEAFLRIAQRRLQVPLLELSENKAVDTIQKISDRLDLNLITDIETGEQLE